MKYLSDYVKDNQTALFERTGCFFAFSEKQFEESKKDNVKYTSLGSGMIVPVDNVKELISGLERIRIEGMLQDVAENGKNNIIERELCNYECFYTYELDDCIEALNGYGYSKKCIENIFQSLRYKYEE